MKPDKLRKFTSDPAMMYAVKETLRESFLKDDGTKDVQYLASKTIAIHLLEKGFTQIQREAGAPTIENKAVKQVGL